MKVALILGALLALLGCSKMPEQIAELKKEIAGLRRDLNEHEAKLMKIENSDMNKEIRGDRSIDLRLELDAIQQRLDSLKADQTIGRQIDAERIEELDHRLQRIENPIRVRH